MNKLVNITFFVFQALCLTLLLGGCDNVFEPPVNRTASVLPGTGRLIIRFGGASPEVAASVRTLLPSNPSFSRYYLVFSPNDGQTGISPISLTNDTGCTVELASGSWDITAKGYVEIEDIDGFADGEYQVAEGSDTVTIADGTSQSITIQMEAILSGGTGTGVLAYDIAFPNSIQSAELEITLLDETEEETVDLLVDGASGFMLLGSGYYYLKITLVNDYGEVLSKIESVHIYDNLITSADYDFDTNDFNEMNDFTGEIVVNQLGGNFPDEVWVSVYGDAAASDLISCIEAEEDSGHWYWTSSGPVDYSNVYVMGEVTYSGYTDPFVKIKGPVSAASTTPSDWTIDMSCYTITKGTMTYGDVELSAGAAPVGTEIVLFAEANEGYGLGSLSWNSTAVSGSTFFMPAQNVTVSAVFNPLPTPQSLFFTGSFQTVTLDIGTTPGISTLGDALAYTNDTAITQSTHYIINVDGNYTIQPTSLKFNAGDTAGVRKMISLRGTGSERIISADTSGGHFIIQPDQGNIVALSLEQNITLQGSSGASYPSVLIYWGELFMSPGSKITGNINTDSLYKTGGVLMPGAHNPNPGTWEGLRFTMLGGEISGNRGTDEGGGVRMGSNTVFDMRGGKIRNNSVFPALYYQTYASGGGVLVSGGTFNMSGGEISGNTGTYGAGIFSDSPGAIINMSGGRISSNNGAGVQINRGTFTMTGGKINGNSAGGIDYYHTEGYSGTFNMSGGFISGNTYNRGGGGVHFSRSGDCFNMSGGRISNNDAPGSYGGGGVYFQLGGTFTMTGGAIIKNTISSGSGRGTALNVGNYGIFTIKGINQIVNHINSNHVLAYFIGN
jgi:hypothetical protein